MDLYRGHDEPPALDLANATRPFAILMANTGRLEEARRLWSEARDLHAAAGIREGVREGDDWLAKLS